MFGTFIKNYGKGKIVSGVAALNDAIIKFDPEGATEAEIQSMEENYDKINLEFSKTKQEYNREQAEADAITKLRDQRMAAAEHLMEQGNNEEALGQLLDALDEMADDVQREIDEAVDAKEVMEELELTVKMYGERLKTARSDLKKAANNMQKAQRQEERADEKAKRAAINAGLTSSVGGLSSALESMNKQAQDAQASADAAKRKSDMLSPIKVEENDAVAAAMAAVSGAAPAPTSAKDRLAAMRSK